MNCKDFDEKLALYLYDELAAGERPAFETHLGSCAGCRARAEQARHLHQLLNERSRPEATPELLALCRQALDAAIDRELASVTWRSLFRSWLSTLGGVSPQRLATALTLLVLGFSLGWAFRPRAAALLPGSTSAVPASLLGADLGNMRINSISQVAPSPETGQVRITVDAERRMTLEGSLDDPHIRQVLVDAVKTYDNPGIRRDSLDALRGRSNDPLVRDALLYAIQNDSNAGMRLEALETVRGLDWSPQVRLALLNTLERDKNPGVRVAAIDALVQHADEAAQPALRRLADSDPNRYVRLKSLTALRKLSGNDF